MHGTGPGPMKNRRFAARLGFAAAGIRLVFARERSFRSQCALALAAILVTIGLRPEPFWWALVALSIALVLSLELANSALEYLLDHLHPHLAREIGAAKDAAAGAVLVASLAAAAVEPSCFLPRSIAPEPWARHIGRGTITPCCSLSLRAQWGGP